MARWGYENVVRYRSSEWAERGFCGKCGSKLFFHYLPKRTYGLLAGLFPDDAEKLSGAEVMAKFGVGRQGN